MTPLYRITCDGADVTEAISKRLVSLRLHDEASFSNDLMELSLDNKAPNVALPNKGAKFEVWLGYKETGLRQMGVYEFDEGQQYGPPHTMVLRARAKDTNSGFKGMKSRSWHGKTIGEIVSKIAGDQGMTPVIDSALEGIKLDHLDQSAQSDMAFLTDLARSNNAILKIVSGKIYFAQRGQAKALDGEVLEVTVPFTEDSGYSHGFQGRGNFAGVRGRYWDRQEAKEKYSGAGQADGENVHTLPEIYNDKDAAERAAKSLYETMQSSTDTLELQLPGNPSIMAESPITISGDYPATIPRSWLCDRAEHILFGNGGYRTTAICVKPKGATGAGGATQSTEGTETGGGDQEEPRMNEESQGDDGYTVTESLDDGGDRT